MHKSVFMMIAAALLLLSGCTEKEKKEASKTQASTAIKVTEGVVQRRHEKRASKANSGEFYYSYNQEKKGDEAPVAEQKHRTTLDAYLHIRSPYERVQIELMIKKLSKDFIVRCSPCHDDYANGVIGPSLLDKNGSFIYRQLIDFKTGKRKNVLMKELVSQIDDEKLKSIAEEIASFNKQIRALRSKREAKTTERKGQ